MTLLRSMRQQPNHALQRTRRGRRGCNRCVPCAGSLSLGRWAAARMYRVALRVQCKSEESALQLIDSFPPDDIECGWTTRRDGASQLFMLYVTSEQEVDEFSRACLARPEVQSVDRITRDEHDYAA